MFQRTFSLLVVLGLSVLSCDAIQLYDENGKVDTEKRLLMRRETKQFLEEAQKGDVMFSAAEQKLQVASSPSTPTGLPNIWPAPKTFTKGTTTLQVIPSANFFQGDSLPQTVTAAFERYQKLCFSHHLPSSQEVKANAVTSLTVTVESADESFPQLGIDESYQLNVDAEGQATLHAKTVYGAMHGLETFSQMLVFDYDEEMYTLPQAPWAIDDAPRFPHRGLMIDTARHFVTLAAIRAVIDSLPYAKLNVLHWHMVDTQSFPFQSMTRPHLWKGAFSPQEKYLQADIEDIVEYARMRGVRVMVEFDVPGHAASWCAGYPEVCPSSSCLQPLNVASNATFELIEDLLSECTGGRASQPGNPSPGLFKDNFVHLGGDEVDTHCWRHTPSVAQWMSDHGLSADGSYAYFVNRVAQMAIAQGHRPVQWSEVYDRFKNKLAKETIVHIWKKDTNVTQVVAHGYNVLLNVGYNNISWYLDNLEVAWAAVYSQEPCKGVPDNLCPLILGGHGEMWGETVDPSDLDQTVWPKLSAIAERLWSPREVRDPTDALERIEWFRCLLESRGVRAAPVTNPNARTAPSGPGSCYKQ
jgi:hexosaminidase